MLSWILATIAGLVVVVWLVMRGLSAAFRRKIRRELIGYVTRERPAFRLVRETEEDLVFHSEETGEAVIHLAKFYAMALEAPDSVQDREAAAYRAVITSFDEVLALKSPTLENCGHRILPRVAHAELLANLDGTLGAGEVVRQPLPGTPLHVVYVFDSSHSVLYLTREHLTALGIDLADLHARSLDNLRRQLPGVLENTFQFLRTPPPEAGDRSPMALVQEGDTYDASRLLLLPERLTEGEELAALVVGRDLLVLTWISGERPGERGELKELLAKPDLGEVICREPLRVTRAGFATWSE